MRRRAGATLAEVMVSSAIFSAFLLIATWMFSRTFLFYRTEEEPARVRQEAALFLHRVTKAIRTCEELLDPPALDTLLKGKRTDYLVVRTVTPEGHRTWGWRLRENRIEEFVYGNEYVSYDVRSQRVLQGPRTVARKVLEFEFRAPDPRQPSLTSLRLRLEPAWKAGRPSGETAPFPLATEVHFRQEQ